MRTASAAGAFLAVVGVTLGACARPIALDGAVTAPEGPPLAARDTAEAPLPPTVEVRYFATGPTVSVVGWHTEDGGYGLRTWIRRDGTLVHDHRFYVNANYVPWMRTYRFAAIGSTALERLGASGDVYACWWGKCTPRTTLGWRLTEEMLRAGSDSVPVTFHDAFDREMTLTLYRDLIDAYLARVDSVRVALRRQFVSSTARP